MLAHSLVHRVGGLTADAGQHVAVDVETDGPADKLPIGAASKSHLTQFIVWKYNSHGNGLYRMHATGIHATVGGKGTRCEVGTRVRCLYRVACLLEIVVRA